MFKKIIILSSISLLLAACASNSNTPETRAIGNWKTVGKIHSGNIEIAYDTGSITHHGKNTRLQDRKTVHDMSKENYLGTPSYKTAIAEWEFACSQRTHRIISARFWDNKGQLLAHQQYTLSPMKIVTNTPSEALFQAACSH